MDELQQLVEKSAIADLTARYCRLMDEKKWDDWEELFTAEAELVTAGTKENARSAIRGMVEAAMTGIPSSHQAFLPEISFSGPTSAQGIWAAMFIQLEGRTTGVGHYHEEYQKSRDAGSLRGSSS